ncbi:MAG: ABC transporter permease subunit [Beijerinckiaceae bacterium]|nr:ABC transporter permease subunit [Beijerinckiaceae bacterium]
MNARAAAIRKAARLEKIIPILVFAALLIGWEALVRVREIPPYILPAPSLVWSTLIADWGTLSSALWVTVRTTFFALALATFGGLALALLFARWRVIEASLFPIAVILQVTPIIAIAPLLLVYLEPQSAVLVCAFIVAFFPILSNAVLGLRSVDRNLVELYKLYGASPWQELRLLRLPAALPYFLGGLRIGGGLALIGAIVAEIAAGAAGRGAGLAFRIVEAGYRLNIPRMFAALVLVSATGVAIYLLFSLLSRLLLGRWHDSEATGQT